MIDGDSQRWKEAWISIHDNGSVSLTAAVGGHRGSRSEYNGDHIVESRDVEVAIADFMGLIRESGLRLGMDEYDVKVGIEWNKVEQLEIWTVDGRNYQYSGSTIPRAQFTPVELTVRANAEAIDFYWQVHDLALDCVNQGGIARVHTISPPSR